MYLENIKHPKDIKALSLAELSTLAQEMRQGILRRVSKQGGHVGSNLGVTELIIALTYVFDFPIDKIIFDVSHQIYPYKMLTGRAFGYLDPSRYNEISGYSSPSESMEFDCFEVGHTSTSVALATGLQKARDMQGGKENIIAVIGDGSLSGGEAFEGLDVAAEIGTNMIIVVNDNEMSIAENHGGLYQNLKLLRNTNGSAELNYFKSLGLDYRYVADGNDIPTLISAFKEVKDCPHPIAVHVHTEKGHGYAPAVENKERFHFSAPFCLETGKVLPPTSGNNVETFPTMLKKYLEKKATQDPKLIVVASATPSAFGFTPDFRKALGTQYVDVGIAEECAAAISSGLAKGGMHPVWSTFGTFIQRSYDQLVQDLCVNNNPAVVNVVGCSVYGMNDISHICFFDIPMLSHIPNLVYLAPTTYEEFVAMEDWAIAQDKYPVAIRLPQMAVVHTTETYDTDYSQLNTYRMVKQGSRVAILALGDFFQKGEKVAERLTEKGINATLINPRFISGLDHQMLNSLKADHELLVTIEDGCIDGGFGERIARYYSASKMNVLCFGIEKALYDRYDVDQLLFDNHLTEEQITDDILTTLKV